MQGFSEANVHTRLVQWIISYGGTIRASTQNGVC